ncbi:hypothetical protein SLEP1_g21446 [Rubroshorea leprosula]|uniref:Uncharacterized protein n=1 Tax=Rubroshorea leprosula TaxID=152421 RepID=A0AAV5JC19_9ROSI|nr:hypothetical protein SLEP1_g21446 [Rubroshorea leprosula]
MVGSCVNFKVALTDSAFKKPSVFFCQLPLQVVRMFLVYKRRKLGELMCTYKDVTSNVVTIWEGEIVDMKNCTFYSGKWETMGFAPTTPDSTSCDAPEWWVGFPTKVAAYKGFELETLLERFAPLLVMMSCNQELQLCMQTYAGLLALFFSECSGS